MYTLLLYIHTAINIYPANFFLSIFLCQRSTFNSEKKNVQTSHSFFKLWVSQKYVQNSIYKMFSMYEKRRLIYT